VIYRKNEEKAKRTYQKPLLRAVSIAPGVQTLGIGCKTAGGGGSLPIAVPCWAIGCAQQGS